MKPSWPWMPQLVKNALSQAKEFSKITPLTGLVLTKLDGSAKGWGGFSHSPRVGYSS